MLEEYFHGEHAAKPHDTRSTAKSVTSALIGAAIQAGIRIGPETRIYPTMRSGVALNVRQRALTLDHLLTMSSGLDCDDNGDLRPGNEDVLTDQDSSPDWLTMILKLDMVREPERSVYCSIQPHVAGGVLERIAGRTIPDLMWELLGQPLDMQQYYLQLAPTGDPYMGGGKRFMPRDFVKFAQLYLDGGTWRGRRILSQDWIDRSIAPRFRIGRPSTAISGGFANTRIAAGQSKRTTHRATAHSTRCSSRSWIS